MTGGAPFPPVPLVAAACVGVAAWFSLGALATATPVGSRAVRLGLLPPWWLLPACIMAAVALAWRLRLSSRTALPLFFSLALLLPWIPGRVPAAFLTWTGHLTLMVWLAVILGVFAAKGVRPLGRWFTDPVRARRLAAAVACALYITSGWWLAEILPAGDEPHYLVITQSLLRDGDLQIENNHIRRDYQEYYGRPLRPDYSRRGTNGQIYSIHAPGLSVVVAPAYAAFGYGGVVVFLSVVAALGAGLLWRACYLLTGNPTAAWFGWAAGALTVPFFFHAFSVFPDGLGATLVLFAAMFLIEGQDEQDRHSGGRWLATGTALALLPWLHARFAIIAAVLGLCLLLRLAETSRGRSHALLLLSIPAASVVAWFSYFRVIYGTFSPAAPYGGYTQSAPVNILTGLPALAFDQQFGVIPNAPVYGFCIVGLCALARHRPRLAIELALAAGAYLISAAAYQMWWGGTSAPARFAVPVLFLLALPGAWLWQHARLAATRMIGVNALVLSLFVTTILAGVNSGRLAFNTRDGYSLGLEWLSSLVDFPQGLPSFFRQTPGGATLRAALWILAILAAWLVLRSIERRIPRSEPSAALALAAPLCLAMTGMVALTAVWKLDHVAAATPEASQLNFLGRFAPRLRPVGVNLTAFDLVSAEAVLSQIKILPSTRRPTSNKSTLLVAPKIVPAGRYRLGLPDGVAGAGTASLVIGSMARPILTWDLRSGLPSGSADFDLPVDVGSLLIQGDAEAMRTVRQVELKPLQLFTDRARVVGGFARRAEPYGAGLAYFFDNGAFLEPSGFWIKGAEDTQIVALPAERGHALQLFVRNAAVPNKLTIEMDGQAQEINLQPREERLVPVAHAHDRPATLIRFQTETGFTPALVEPGSTDTRFLGCWIELR